MDIEHNFSEDKKRGGITISASEGSKILRTASGTMAFSDMYIDHVIEKLQAIKEKIEKERPE